MQVSLALAQKIAQNDVAITESNCISLYNNYIQKRSIDEQKTNKPKQQRKNSKNTNNSTIINRIWANYNYSYSINTHGSSDRASTSDYYILKLNTKNRRLAISR